MATFASNVVLKTISSVSRIEASYYYETFRSGNSVRNRAWVSLYFTGSSQWFNDRVRAVITIGGTQVLNSVIKGNTSGAIGGKRYDSTWSSYKDINQNSGNISFSYRLYDEQNTSLLDSTRTYSSSSPAPTAPSVPGSAYIGSVAPDKVANASWGASSGGTNGVSGYEFTIQKEGGSWREPYWTTTSTATTFTLSAYDIKHGNRYRIGVRSYSTVNGTKYYSGFRYSDWATAVFVAPGNPTNLTGIGTIAPDKNSTVSWAQPGSTGSNGIGGYEVQLYVDGSMKKQYNLGGGTRSVTLEISSYAANGSNVYYRVRTYTIGSGTKYYSSWVNSGTISTWFVAPSVPTGLSLPNVAPDKSTTGTWSAPTSGGSNGVSGYEIAYSRNGGTSQYPGTTTSRSYAFDLNSIGVQQGEHFRFAVRAYTIGKGVRYASSWVWSSYIYPVFTAPGAPTGLTALGSLAPDQNKTVSWVAPTSTGSNGISGYQVYLYVGGTRVATYNTNASTRKVTLEISKYAKHGNTVYYSVWTKTIGKGVDYWSPPASSSTITTVFVAPGVPTSLGMSYNTEEPIPTSTFTFKWVKPTSVGTNNVTGYEVDILVNNVSKGIWTTTTTSVNINMSTLNVQPDDIVTFKVRAYTTGQSVKYYSSWDSTNNTVIIVADKFIFVSIDGQPFDKHKMFFIYPDGTVREIKKSMLKVIT